MEQCRNPQEPLEFVAQWECAQNWYDLRPIFAWCVHYLWRASPRPRVWALLGNSDLEKATSELALSGKRPRPKMGPTLVWR